MDEWYDEDERAEGHFTDRTTGWTCAFLPARPRPAGGTVLAATSHRLLLSETGLPNRFYIRLPTSARTSSRRATPTPTALQGHGLALDGQRDGRKLTDAISAYSQAAGDPASIAGDASFLHDDLIIDVGDLSCRPGASRRELGRRWRGGPGQGRGGGGRVSRREGGRGKGGGMGAGG